MVLLAVTRPCVADSIRDGVRSLASPEQLIDRTASAGTSKGRRFETGWPRPTANRPPPHQPLSRATIRPLLARGVADCNAARPPDELVTVARLARPRPGSVAVDPVGRTRLRCAGHSHGC